MFKSGQARYRGCMKNVRQIIELQTLLEHGFRTALLGRGFLQIHCPIFTAMVLEPYGGAFTVDYYGKEAYLAQSPQAYKQLAIGMGLRKVFAVGENLRKPSKRAPGLMTEFTTWDLEIAGLTDLRRLEVLVREVMTETLRAVAKRRLGGERRVRDLTFAGPFPAHERAFYFRRSGSGRAARSQCFDVLLAGVEIGSGGLREHRPARLMAQAKAAGVSLKRLRPYLEMFRSGMPPHGGVSISPARLMQALLGAPSSVAVTLFPRTPTDLTP